MKRPLNLITVATETRISEWVNLIASCWWTLLLWLPSHLFATQPSFAALAASAPERQWGCFTGLCAVLILLGLLHSRPLLRVLGLAAAAGLWLFVAALLAQGAPVTALSLSWPWITAHWPWAGAHLLHLPLRQNTGIGAYTALALGNVAGALLLSPYMMADLLAAVERRKADRKSGLPSGKAGLP